jgi:hypothetical protein
MDAMELGRNLQELWQNKPGVMVLLAVGFIVFLFLVVDTWRHKHRRRRRGPKLH